MIKKFLTLSVLATALYANEHTTVHSTPHACTTVSPHTYIVLKGLVTTGDTTSHGHHVALDGDSAKGLGLDLGYPLSHAFAVELTTSYASADVTETDTSDSHHPHHETLSATYLTYGMALVFNKHINHQAGIFAKVGVEREKETLNGHTQNDVGALFAIGAEYKILPGYELLAEYEKSTIAGPKGSSIYLGLKTNLY